MKNVKLTQYMMDFHFQSCTLGEKEYVVSRQTAYP